MRLSIPSLYAKPPPAYSGLSKQARLQVDTVNPRCARPSQLAPLAEALYHEGAISLSQRTELVWIRKAYANDQSDEPLDLVSMMDRFAESAPAFERYVPGSRATAYYQAMARFAHWLDDTAALHRQAPLLDVSA